MNKTVSAFLATAAFATVSPAITVTDVSAHQRWPWNNKVDVGVAGEQLVFTRS